MSDLNLTFNVLTDPWIPLRDGQGEASHASYVELITGERDAPDLVHPRDDCRFFARMLLSALTQALFPPANLQELRARLEAPLPREQVAARVKEVKDDFELVGPNGFMQTELTAEERNAAASPSDASEPTTSSLFLDVPRKSRHLLFRPATECEAVCPSCAASLVYGSQAFAMEDGKSRFKLRGNSPSVRGRPATTTLVLAPTVRTSAWANVLHDQRPPELGHAPDGDRPWRQARTEKPKGAPFGLLEGLFWQPRAFHLVGTTDGVCFACGVVGPRLVPLAWRSKSQAKEGALFRHPWTPVREDMKKRKFEYVRLPSDRPAWTGLVDLIAPVAGTKATGDRIVHAAPVVQQWHRIAFGADASLMLLDIGTTRSDRATPASRVCENFPLSLRIADPDVADVVRECVKTAEKALDALRSACVKLHLKARPRDTLKGPRRNKERKEKDLIHDPSAAFWQQTEPSFWKVYEAAVGDSIEARERAETELQAKVCNVARDLFDRWADASAADPSRLAVVAEVRVWLQRLLPWPEPRR